MEREPFIKYISEINEEHLQGDDTEHTHRPALKKLVEALGKNIVATNEPKQLTECGKPDIKVGRKIRRFVETFGYIECKDIGMDLKKQEKEEQIKRYRGGLV